MVKIRLQGTTNELRRMKRVIERNKQLSVIDISDVYPNVGTKKYFRQYMDVRFNQEEREERYRSR